MKSAVVLLAVFSLALSAPQPKKIFHENYEDFADLIDEEVGDDLRKLMDLYNPFEEFQATLTYMETLNFRELVYEMESLPEFKAMQNYLDTHNIDISYFIDVFNNAMENLFDDDDLKARIAGKVRQAPSGRDFDSFIKDCTAALPKEKLSALYQQKMAEDEDFKAAMEGITSEEFDDLFEALIANPQFQAEVKTLEENGINILSLLDQIAAIFGQDLQLP